MTRDRIRIAEYLANLALCHRLHHDHEKQNGNDIAALVALAKATALIEAADHLLHNADQHTPA
jgi:hypothetical protein